MLRPLCRIPIFYSCRCEPDKTITEPCLFRRCQTWDQFPMGRRDLEQRRSPLDPTMGGIPLAPALFFGCLGEVNKAPSSFAYSALHPLRRRAKSCSKTDPPRFTTLLPTTSAPGALLLSSYLLVHFILPRMRNLSMESTENAVPVCLLCFGRASMARYFTWEFRLIVVTSSEPPIRDSPTSIPYCRRYSPVAVPPRSHRIPTQCASSRSNRNSSNSPKAGSPWKYGISLKQSLPCFRSSWLQYH